MTKYDPSNIEPKWQKVWAEKEIYEPDIKKSPKPFYNLMMFPYPSAEGLHVGNMYAFTGSDIYGRFKRMQGFSVFEPIGLDGFGIHSENYALRVGKHPAKLAKETEKNFYRQFHATGNGYAWKEKLETYDPDYYKWTQWIFVQMFKRGLAYRGKAKVNWCPKCLTVLSDEQVVMGTCERCKTPVEKKELEQWFFKITNYADRLLSNLEKINWSQKVKTIQRNWIGKSEGAEIEFRIMNSELRISVFTTRPDTLFGATFLILSPEHPLIEKFIENDRKDDEERYKLLTKYINESKNKSQEERIEGGFEKTGVFSGFYGQNPVTGEKMPIWVADYVLMTYGTGVVMGVPAHDERDFDFAKKYDLPIREVIKGGDINKGAYAGEGELVNSGPWDGWKMPQEMEKVMHFLEEKKLCKKSITYRIRDWCISRQRYWGPPIPMIDCPKCGWQPVPESDLPVLLPEVEDWRPKGAGESPLANIESFVKTKCPSCQGSAERETDVSDTFLDSSWYFFRYPSVHAEEEKMPFDAEITRKWLPVDMYVGGAEHAVLHLLYSRFMTMVFKDWGLIDFEEPYERFYAHGLLISEGAKISKSRGNLIVTDDYINRYGADTFRCYLMFLGPFDQGGDFREAGIMGLWRFLNRVWNLVLAASRSPASEKSPVLNLEKIRHQTIKRVTKDLENLRYNTALSALMEYSNGLISSNEELSTHLKTLLLLLAPFAPHLTEELWEKIGEKFSIHTQPWPEFDESLTKEEMATLAVCINGKIRDQLEIESSVSHSQEEIEKLARQRVKVQKYLEGKNLRKTVFVPGKLINFVV